ncbi:MAG: hypothetical protein ABI967_08120 [bacterium]
MLLVASQTLNYTADTERRIHLLEQLQEKNLTPLIRSARLNCFGHALLGPDRIAEMESAIAASLETDQGEPYVRGDVFCLEDHVFFLVFGSDKKDAGLIRSGIVYSANTTEPFRKLDFFCREVRDLVLPPDDSVPAGTAGVRQQWQQGKPAMPEGFKRFVGRQDTDSLFTSLRKETMSQRVRATSILEDPTARIFLRRAKDAHVEGYASKLLTGDTLGSHESSIGRLEDAGLVEREVQVSCRKTGHALFRLPTAHALAVVTVSDATCSECGAPVADEKVEEVIAPTRLAASLLEDGSWLISRLHYILREMGISESEIALGPSEGEGYGQMMANICGESFLLVARDGELTPAFARWAIDLEVETEASHLVVVATGRIHNQAGVLLHNHARHRVRSGQNFELILADEAAVAGAELRHAFDRVSQRVVAEHLCELDSEFGLSIGQLVITKFKMLPEAEKVADVSDLSEPSVPDYSYARRPLTLAAHASAAHVEVLDVEEFISTEPNDSLDLDNDENFQSVISGNQPSETAI